MRDLNIESVFQYWNFTEYMRRRIGTRLYNKTTRTLLKCTAHDRKEHLERIFYMHLYERMLKG